MEENGRLRPVSRWRTLMSLRLEPVILVYIAVLTSRMTAMQQMLQDKICQQVYQQPDEYCLTLSDAPSTPTKNAILADVSTYMSGREFFNLLPNLVLGLFAGSWCDRFPNARRYCLFTTLLGQILETSCLMLNAVFYELDFRFILLTGLPAALAGNLMFTVALSYVSVNEDPVNRSFRYLLIDVFMSIGAMTGFFMGGSMLSYTSPICVTGLRNFVDVLLLSALMIFLALVWSYFLVVDYSISDKTQLLSDDGNDGEQAMDPPDQMHNPGGGCCPSFRSLFDPSHVRDVWITFSRERPNGNRRTFYLLLLTIFLISAPAVGAILTFFPLTERLYKWDYKTYSYFQILSQIVRPIVTGVYIAAIVKGLGLQDLEISVIGIVSSFLGYVAIASITSSTGFYIQIVASSVGLTATSGARAFLTKLIPASETSKVLCIMLALESLQPSLASYLMSSLFSASINFYPTLALHASASLLLIALIIVCVIDLSDRKSRLTLPVQPAETCT